MIIENSSNSNEECVQDNDLELCKVKRVSILDLIWIVSMILQRIISFGVNLYLLVHYYMNNLEDYFIWTLTCMIASLILTTIIHSYIHSHGKVGSFIKCCHVIIFAITFRYTRLLYYSLLSRKHDKEKNKHLHLEYYKKVIREDSDLALLRIFECFFEVAPQTILQIVIVILGRNVAWIQISSICQSLIGLSWCMVTYQRYNRFSQADKENMSLQGAAFYTLYHFCIATSRILSISFILLINEFRIIVLLAGIFHSLICGSLIFFYLKPVFMSENIISSILFCGILGVIYIFVFLMPAEGDTKIPSTIYHALSLIEIFLMSYAFYAYNKILFEDGLVIFLTVLPIFLFCFGIIIMIYYYMKLHPTKKAFRDISRNINSSNEK
ncbi:XK-related protein 6 [Condylostylus longicornis]|uniref:XK-related protein 6 n=1 Tax=Condylostylus longicornis TaxID=2530218 RepID=UPI00244E3DCB|nr:XK-related protein 6 [Condylostylus longicornis]